MLGGVEDPIGERYISVLASEGFDYVELPLAQVMDLSDHQFNQLLILLQNNSIPCLSCNNFFPATIRLTGNQVDYLLIEKYVEKSMRRASLLGADIIVFGSSGAKNISSGFPYRLAYHQIVETLQIVEKYAARYNIQIAVEPLNRTESNIICNLSEGNQLVMDVDRPHIHLLVDYYHMNMVNDSLNTLNEVMPEIIHVHFAEPAGRKFPNPNNLNIYKNFFQVLLGNEYNNSVSIEAYTSDYIKDIRRSIYLMREMIS